MAKWEKLPYQYFASNDQSENGGMFDRKLSIFARKAGYHYGWDWGPRLVMSGIWREVFLDGWDNMRIDDTHYRQREVSAKKVALTDVIHLTSDKSISNATVNVRDKVSGRILVSKKCDIEKGRNDISIDFTIKNPCLWWCNGLGKPDLYTFSTEIEKNGEILASSDERIGIRSIRVVTDNDSDGNMQFYFVLNGVPVFAKGTNYIPQDNFLPSVTPERYKATIDDTVNANMNMVRIWGGGIYEDDLFYDLCDESGLMVWQDFMFACSVYPAQGNWLESVRNEAIDNVCRLRNHPCIALWCGGTGCLDAWYNWGWKRKISDINPQYTDIIEVELNRQYFETLPEVIAKYAPESFYWSSSPFTAQGQGSDGINGDRYYWTVWLRKAPIDSYNRDMAHFFSEYGMQSFPEYNSVIKFAPDTDIDVFTIDGTKVYCGSSKITIPANMSTNVWESPLQSLVKSHDYKSLVINIGIECDGYNHNGNYYLCKQKELQLSTSDIKMEINPSTDGYILNLKSDKFVRAIWLSVNDDSAKFNDNCFDLLPGIAQSCAIKTDLSPSEIQSRLKIQCLNNI